MKLLSKKEVLLDLGLGLLQAVCQARLLRWREAGRRCLNTFPRLTKRLFGEQRSQKNEAVS